MLGPQFATGWPLLFVHCGLSARLIATPASSRTACTISYIDSMFGYVVRRCDQLATCLTAESIVFVSLPLNPMVPFPVRCYHSRLRASTQVPFLRADFPYQCVLAPEMLLIQRLSDLCRQMTNVTSRGARLPLGETPLPSDLTLCLLSHVPGSWIL
jgi:hypothetical protein